MFWKRPSSVEWIVVFLGNPGPKYSGTRHNVGFMTADIAEKSLNVRINKLKFSALTAAGEVGGIKMLLMKPQTYMNLSGSAVHQAMDFYKVPLDRVLVVSDDVSLPVGKLRIRREGSAGGHNGLKDIIAKCGGEGFPRVKIGVGSPPHSDYDMADWVLGVFRNKDAEDITAAVKCACMAVFEIIENGVDSAMNKFN
ncbi:MAG: aminoacyl-tRNA hydrolase [Oscillospiraceae bacterium]